MCVHSLGWEGRLLCPAATSWEEPGAGSECRCYHVALSSDLVMQSMFPKLREQNVIEATSIHPSFHASIHPSIHPSFHSL